MRLRLVANVRSPRTVEIRRTVGERLRTLAFIERRAADVCTEFDYIIPLVILTELVLGVCTRACLLL